MNKPSMPPGPVSGPGVWYGRDLQRHTDWMRHFTAVEPMRARSRRSPTWGSARGSAARSQNAKGHLLGHVKDLDLDIKDPNVRYYQTSRRLEYHTDSVDVVGLLCLKTAKSGGESFIASSMTLYNEVLARRPDLLPALFEPYPTDRRGEVPEGMQPWFDMPVYHHHAGRLTCIYVRQYIESAQKLFPQAKRLRREQVEAMDLLDELLNEPQIHLSMAFLPGDMQFLHNHQTLHSRNDFENWPERERAAAA